MKIHCVMCRTTAHQATAKSKWSTLTVARKGNMTLGGWICPACASNLQPEEEKAVKPEYEKRDDE